MKNKQLIVKTHLTAMVFFLCLFLVIYSCKDPVEPPVVDPPETERIGKLLQGSGTPWGIQSVKVDDVVLDLYKNLNVSFTADGKYTSTNGGKVWPASGTWQFKNDEAKAIIREDGLEITIDDITEKGLTISFTRAGGTEFEDGRNKAVGGRHVLVLGR